MSTLFGVDQHIAYVDTLNACPKLPDASGSFGGVALHQNT